MRTLLVAAAPSSSSLSSSCDCRIMSSTSTAAALPGPSAGGGTAPAVLLRETPVAAAVAAWPEGQGDNGGRAQLHLLRYLP